MTVRLLDGQKAFWERKKAEIKRRMHSSRRNHVSNSTMLQALVELWMVIDANGDVEAKIAEFEATK